MNYFKVFFIHDPDPVPPFWYPELPDSWTDYLGFDSCEPITDVQSVPIEIERRGRLADYNESVVRNCLFVSERLAKVFTEFAEGDVQLIPAKVEAPGNWFVAHVLACPDAIDHRRSVIQYRDLDDEHRPGEPRGALSNRPEQDRRKARFPA